MSRNEKRGHSGKHTLAKKVVRRSPACQTGHDGLEAAPLCQSHIFSHDGPLEMHWYAILGALPVIHLQFWAYYTVIHLQFWADGSWDSLMSPTANLRVQNTIFNGKSAILLHPGTR